MALILIAEDAQFTRRMLKRILQEDGHETLEASNGSECLEMLLLHKPDCLILDLLMPDLTGYEVLAALRERNYQLPVIVVTADIQDTSRQQCLELGAFAVVNKPPKPNEFLKVLQDAINAQKEKV